MGSALRGAGTEGPHRATSTTAAPEAAPGPATVGAELAPTRRFWWVGAQGWAVIAGVRFVWTGEGAWRRRQLRFRGSALDAAQSRLEEEIGAGDPAELDM